MQTLSYRTRYIRNLDHIEQLSSHEINRLKPVVNRFTFRTNDYYLNLIDWSDPNDPIRNLIIPKEEELEDTNECDLWDVSNEASNTKAKGVQHKYFSTVILLCNEVCGSYCRYCFRKRLFMEENEEVSLDISKGLEYIASNPNITNVLLTGGDPLLLSTRRLESILYAISQIPHVRIIRIGSKQPAFDPWRILNDEDLLDILARYSRSEKRLYLMTHFDHPRELTEPAVELISRCVDEGILCCNQCPIIKGVNNCPVTLGILLRELSFLGCPPYYLFQIRPTIGNRPYIVPIVQCYNIFQDAIRETSGLASRARYVMSHETGKIEIIGVDERYIYMRYHRAKNPADVGRIMVFHRNDSAYWLDQLVPVENPY